MLPNGIILYSSYSAIALLNLFIGIHTLNTCNKGPLYNNIAIDSWWTNCRPNFRFQN